MLLQQVPERLVREFLEILHPVARQKRERVMDFGLKSDQLALAPRRMGRRGGLLARRSGRRFSPAHRSARRGSG
ncbi:MAG TPA: hypothetical protein VFI85_09060 [Methyloceanibacter sp.]|nr:hypothetical protein [Methyloceanibacter sp.]